MDSVGRLIFEKDGRECELLFERGIIADAVGDLMIKHGVTVTNPGEHAVYTTKEDAVRFLISFLGGEDKFPGLDLMRGDEKEQNSNG